VVICGGDGGERLERKITGLISLEKSCGGGQNPPRAAQLLMKKSGNRIHRPTNLQLDK
jgi:hypothetical protein